MNIEIHLHQHNWHISSNRVKCRITDSTYSMYNWGGENLIARGELFTTEATGKCYDIDL